jgi:hypothetical protein
MLAIAVQKLFAGAVVRMGTSYVLASTANNNATFTLKATGQLELIDDAGTVHPLGQWLGNNPDAASAALYEVQRTQVSGVAGLTLVGGMLTGTWYTLNADRGIIVASTSTLHNNQSTWIIRRISDQVTVASFSTDLTSGP